MDNDDSLDPRNLAARDIIIALLNHGVDPTLADNNCIKWACMMGWVNVLLLLLKNKDVDITADDSDCIRKAAVNGRVELLQLLAADERFPSTGFCDALNAAADVDENQVIEFILNTPAFNHADEDALGFRTAAEYGHVDHVRHGLNSSLIDPGILENEAIRFAAGNGHVEIVKLLIGDPRVDPSDCDDDALREAAGHGHLEVVKLLIEDKRVDPSSWNFEALGRAAEEDHQEIFTLLSQRCDMMQMVKQIQQKLEFYNDFVTHWS